jgi:hypothetical protein
MIVAKINIKKIDKSLFFEGKNGPIMDIVFHDNKEGEDPYGNLGFVTQSVSKEARERGERGPIIGNWKEIGKKRPASAPKPASKPANDFDQVDDDLPF